MDRNSSMNLRESSGAPEPEAPDAIPHRERNAPLRDQPHVKPAFQRAQV